MISANITKLRAPKKELKTLPPIERFIAETRRLVAGDGWRRICLPYPVSVNRSYGLGVIAGRATMFPTAEAKRYRKWVTNICLATGQRPIIGNVQVLVDLYRERKAGDSDPTKLLFDSLEGFAYENDRQICNHLVNRMDDPSFPRCVVSLRLKPGETANLDFGA